MHCKHLGLQGNARPSKNCIHAVMNTWMQGDVPEQIDFCFYTALVAAILVGLVVSGRIFITAVNIVAVYCNATTQHGLTVLMSE